MPIDRDFLEHRVLDAASFKFKIGKNLVMARNKPTPKDTFVMFNVLYEDGTQTSNRKVPSGELGGLEGDVAIDGIIGRIGHHDN